MRHWSLIIILIIASFLRLHNFIPLEIRPAEGTAAAARGGLSLTGLIELPPGLHPDEAMNGNNAVEALENRDWKVFYPENFGREGLFINIQSWLIGLMGLISPMDVNQPWALRLPSAIFGILTVLGLYFLTKELFKNRQLALLAAFLLATSFWHINFSRIGFRVIMAPFFLTWSLYFLFLSLRKTNQSSVVSHWSLVAAATGGLLYGLGFYSYIAYRATPILLLFVVYYCYKTNALIRANKGISLLVFIMAAVIAVAPLGIYFFQNLEDFFGRTALISVFSSQQPWRDLGLNILKTAGMFNVAGDFNWRHNVAGRPLLFWPVGLFFLAGIIFSFKNLKMDWKFGIPLAWLAVAFLPVVISNEGLPHALRSLLMAPPVFILAAVGGLKIYEFLKLKLKLSGHLLSVVVYVFCSLLVFESYVTYFVTWGQNPSVKNAFSYNDSVIADYLNSLPKELPKYIAVKDAPELIERDNPISLQSILFLTDTFSNEKRKEKNFYYLSSEEAKSVSKNDFLIYLP